MSSPTFRHSVDEEPTENWTFGDIFEWCLLQSFKAVDNHGEGITAGLTAQFEDVEKQLWETHKQAVAYQQKQPSSNVENQVPSEVVDTKNNTAPESVQAETKTMTAESVQPKTTTPHSVQAEIMAGPYQGQVFTLQPTRKKPCLVGRSRGRNYKTRGISLPEDLEVSTTHGKFELNAANQICFTDLSSTNGTWVGGQQLEPDIPLELTDGMELTCGQSLMKITLIY